MYLCHQRQIRRKRIVVRSACSHIVSEEQRNVIRRDRLASRRFTGLRINRRRFNRPVGSDRLYFGFTITKAFQIAESDETPRVTRRADFLEYLEPTLQLRTIIMTERAIGCEFKIGRASGRESV